MSRRTTEQLITPEVANELHGTIDEYYCTGEDERFLEEQASDEARIAVENAPREKK